MQPISGLQQQTATNFNNYGIAVNSQLNKDISTNQSANDKGGYVKAAYVAGIVVTWGYIQPESILGGLATIVTGVALTVVSHALVHIGGNLYDQWMHRIASPILLRPTTKEYENTLNAAIERLTKHPNYQLFKNINNLDNELKTYEFLKCYFSGGTCHGSSVELLRKIKLMPQSSCQELLCSINIENLYYFQLLSIMKASICCKESKYREHAWRIKCIGNFSNPNFKNLYSTRGDNPECSDENSELSKQIEKGKYLAEISKELEAELTPWNEFESECFSIKKSPEEFDHHWGKMMSFDQEFSGRIDICGNEEDMGAGRGGHAITFQVLNGKFRYYDTINAFSGGFYEYSDVNKFCSALRKQIISDLYGYNDVMVKFFKADHKVGS